MLEADKGPVDRLRDLLGGEKVPETLAQKKERLESEIRELKECRETADVDRLEKREMLC